MVLVYIISHYKIIKVKSIADLYTYTLILRTLYCIIVV